MQAGSAPVVLVVGGPEDFAGRCREAIEDLGCRALIVAVEELDRVANETNPRAIVAPREVFDASPDLFRKHTSSESATPYRAPFGEEESPATAALLVAVDEEHLDPDELTLLLGSVLGPASDR